MKRLVLGLIIFYQRIFSPDHGLWPRRHCGCRFYPSCSVYAHEAVERFGIFYGSLKSLRRILRCHPFCPGGYDPLKNQ